jgi:hypothetical protein
MNAAAAKAAKLSDVAVELSVNGEVKVNGSGAAVFEDPINSLVFLADEIGGCTLFILLLLPLLPLLLLRLLLPPPPLTQHAQSLTTISMLATTLY